MTSAPDLVTYLLARLDEEELAAIAAPKGPWHVHLGPRDGYPQTILGGGGQPVLVAETCDGPVDGTGLRRSPTTAQYIAYWHPARALAEIAAKRILLSQVRFTIEYRGALSSAGVLATPTCPENWQRCSCARCWAAYALLMPYAERPDFHPGWRAE